MQLKNMKVRYMDVASRHLNFSRFVFRQINQKRPFFEQGILTDGGADWTTGGTEMHPKWSQVSDDEGNSQTKPAGAVVPTVRDWQKMKCMETNHVCFHCGTEVCTFAT